MDLYSSMSNESAFWQKIVRVFSECDYDWVEDLLKANNVGAHSDDLAVLYYLWSVYEKEKKDMRPKTIIDKCDSLEDYRRRYISLKFYLRRIEYELMDGDMYPFYEFLAHDQISSWEISEVMKCCVLSEHMDKVSKSIQG